MSKFKSTSVKVISSIISSILVISALTCGSKATAYASERNDGMNGKVISYSIQHISPTKQVEVTVYDLGDGYTATETTVTEDTNMMSRASASGDKTQNKDVELKNGKETAATIKVSAVFSYDGSRAAVKEYNQSKTIRSGYTETAWNTDKGDSTAFKDAFVSAKLTVKNDKTGKSVSGSAKVTCSKNG
ncbi:hypothetical protein [Anaerotignum sp.]|uniref:hypothetical protein n=1 Tax=Anaerotignum sp. TaxID=2039241 RepID=UPI002A912B4F|nr:hypothetical protein [Anaerotignum sp.]MDY5415072.1 hypothetical protein [Anaerotignum sp.]